MSLEALSEEQESVVLKEINYSKNQLNQDVATLRDWIAKQEHLPASRLKEPDAFYENYLVGCKGSLEACKKKLDLYYSIRGTSQLFLDRDPFSQSVRNTVGNYVLATMPKPTPDGARLNIMYVSNPDATAYDFIGTIQRILAISENRVRTDGLNGGEHCVLDGQNYTASHVLRVNPTVVRDAITYVQDSLPSRIKQIYFINCPPVLEIAVNKLFKPFLKKKLADRIIVSQEGASVLLERYPKEILPKDYGGDAPSMSELSDAWLKKYEQSKELFTKNLMETTNEKLRPVDAPFSTNPYFGLQGSIKTLSID